MFDQLGNCSSAPSKMYDSKPCRPDYEGVVKKSRERLAKNQKLQSALFDYVGDCRLHGQLAEMVGELVSDERAMLAEIEYMIAEQEKDDKP